MAKNISHKNSNLEKEISRCHTHSWLDVSDQQVTDKDMEIIISEALINKKCLGLNLRYNKITSVGASILADALQNNTSLQILYLSYNQLSDKGVRYLADALSTNTTLTELQLESNEITDLGIQYLSDMIKTNRTLIHLGLGANNIGDRGVELLSHSLTHPNTNLEVLNIRENKSITDQSVDYLIHIIKHSPSLNKLSVNHCSLSKPSITKLRQITEQKHSFVLGTD